MPARKKRLADFIADQSFLARRHAALLEEDDLVDEPTLRALQDAYREEPDGLERQKLARRFQQTVREGPRRRRPPFGAIFYSMTGPNPGDHDQLATLGLRGKDGIDWPAVEKLQRRWRWWAGRYGLLWRAKHGVTGHDDNVALHRRLSGDRRNKRADVAGLWLDAHREQVDELIASREPIPDPPVPRRTIDDVLVRM
jgi:hypothetical protein